MWYENNYRRHLCDMHIADWNDEFLSKFSAEEYCKNILTAGFNEAMVYLQSHVGYCNFPTKVGTQHRAFCDDDNELKKLIDLLHSNDVAVVGYYSLVFNTIEHDKHKSWRLIGADGMSDRENTNLTSSSMSFSEAPKQRYGHCCPNNAEYRNFLVQQINEMAAFAKLEGMFYDMTYWPKLCYCESCKKRWREEVGGELNPNVTKNSEEYLAMIRKYREWINEFAHFVTDETKRAMPGVTVEHNVAFSGLDILTTCNSVGVHDACDYSGGDIHNTPYIQSFACKFYRNITKNQPFEFMIARCDPGLYKHTSLKSKDRLLSSIMLTTAHHGASLVIDAIDPCGTLDGRVYKHLGEVFDYSKRYEKYLNGRALADVGIYYGLDSKYNKYGSLYDNYTSATGLDEKFIKNNILTDVTGVFDKKDLSRFKMIFAPLLTYDDRNDNARLIKYVENGGVLYISGADNRELTEKLLGGKITGITDEITTYSSPTGKRNWFEYFTHKYPFNVDSAAAIIEGVEDCEVVATLTLPYTKPGDSNFAAIHSNPPGVYTDIPSIIIKDYGKGKVIWSAQPFESEQIDIYGIIFSNMVHDVLGKDLLVKTNAHKKIELTVFDDDKYIYISAVHIHTDYYAERLGEFDVSLKCSKRPQRVEYLPDETTIEFTYSDGYVHFKAKSLLNFDMYRVVL